MDKNKVSPAGISSPSSSESEDFLPVLDVDSLAWMAHPTALEVVEGCIGGGGIEGADGGRDVLGGDGGAGLDVEVEQVGEEEVVIAHHHDEMEVGGGLDGFEVVGEVGFDFFGFSWRKFKGGVEDFVVSAILSAVVADA